MEPKQTAWHLAVAFDEHYLTPFYVLLTSVFHNHPGCRLHLHIAASGIPDEEQQKIRAFVQAHHAGISFYNLASVLQGVRLPVRSRFTPSTYYRLFLPQLVPPQVQKLLFVDVDAVVIGSLQPLYETDISAVPLAAVVQPNAPARPELGIHECRNYFNAGVLLINVPEWRRQNILEQSLRFLELHPQGLKWLDQDVLNAVLVNNYCRLPLCYNVRYNDIPADLPRRQYKNFLKDKVIIHYTTGNKPWLALGRNRLRFLYHHYLRKSPRSFEKKYPDFTPSGRMLYHYLRIRVAERLLDYPFLMGLVRRVRRYRKKQSR